MIRTTLLLDRSLLAKTTMDSNILSMRQFQLGNPNGNSKMCGTRRLVGTFSSTKLTLFKGDTCKLKIKARWIRPNEWRSTC
jgi:hypothetical protein